MSGATTAVLLPESVVRAAEVQAHLRGISVEEWVSRAVAERLDTVKGVCEFFDRRAAGATGDMLQHALNAAPDALPSPGDELPDGWVSVAR